MLFLSVPKTWGDSENAGPLGTFLMPRLKAALEQRGYAPEENGIRIRSVSDVSLRNQTDEGSGVFESVQISLMVSLRGQTAPDGEEEISLPGFSKDTPMPAGTPAAAPDGEEEISLPGFSLQTPQPSASPDGWTDLPQPLVLTLSYFGEVESAFSLSLNGSNNEVTTVREEPGAFVLEARRYGHGVGLSQRGAQRMAAREGWGYRQILRYYYQGITLRRVRYTYQSAAALSAAFLSTPAPPATPTPRPTLMPVTVRAGETRVIVDRISSDSTLNLRRENNTTSEILMRLYYGQELAVIGTEGDWLRVRTDTVEGYVMSKYVTAVPEE